MTPETTDTDTDSDSETDDLEEQARRVRETAADVVGTAADAVEQTTGLDGDPGTLRDIERTLDRFFETYRQTHYAIQACERALQGTDRGPTPAEILDEHADRIEDRYDRPVRELALMLLEHNRRKWLYQKPDTHGAEQVRRHGLTTNQREWLQQCQDALGTDPDISADPLPSYAVVADVAGVEMTGPGRTLKRDAMQHREALTGWPAVDEARVIEYGDNGTTVVEEAGGDGDGDDDDDAGAGLYDKYAVAKDGEPVEECFVLEPEDDFAAREALLAYAEETDDEALAEDLREWVKDLCTRGGDDDGE